MSESEDPEQRIRDLEQSASAAPPPGGFHDGPYEAPPFDAAPTAARQAGGPDRRGVSTLLFGLGLLIIVLAAAAFLLFGREPTAGTPVAAIDHSAPPRPPASTPAPTPRPRLTPPVIPSPPTIDDTSPTVVADGGSVSVSGIAEHRTLTCTGGTVEISGINNTVEITGHCERVTVSGIENVITLDSADVIEASGIGSRVTYHSGEPRIDSSGSDVTVQPG